MIVKCEVFSSESDAKPPNNHFSYHHHAFPDEKPISTSTNLRPGMSIFTNKSKDIDKKNEEKRRKAAARGEDSDDRSENWTLPKWPELEMYNRPKKHRKRRHHTFKKENKNRSKVSVEGQEETVPLANVEGEGIGAIDVVSSDLHGEDAEEETCDDESKARGRWNNSWEFLMSIISMSVGLGNFYRFPFIAYQNGGGVFLIPYLIILTFVGRPMYFLELAIGQFCSFGQIKCWEMSPFFRGVGFGSTFGSFCALTFYSSVMGVTLYYLVNSFREKLPWTVCDPEWATQEVCQKIIDAAHNGTNPRTLVNLPQLYYENQVMKEKNSIDDGIGIPDWQQALCLLASWLMIFFVIAKGVQASGKVAYFTSIFPYIVIIVLLVTACTKEGSLEGMLYFIKPDWRKIADPKVWFAAAGQCFFSLGVGFGPIINYASYNPFHHPIYKDVLIVSFMDTLASVLAGLTVFATLGTLSHDLKKPIETVVKGGPGLAFISFSDAISQFAFIPQLLSVLFFLMLFTLAIGSAAAWALAPIAVISDQFPKLSHFWISTATCMAGFLLSLIYVTPGGQFMLTLVDSFGGNINIYILATLECVGIAWVYGLSNTIRDIEFMLGSKINIFYKICWGFVIPVLLTLILIYTMVTSKRLTYDGKSFPDSAIICGWILTSMSIVLIPVAAIYAMCKSSGNLKERFFASLRPTERYGPYNPSDRKQWELLCNAGKLDLLGNSNETTLILKTDEDSNHSSARPDDCTSLVVDETEVVKALSPNIASEIQTETQQLA